MTAASDEVAVCTSDSVASEPAESPAPVKVRVPFSHTSAASVPNPVRVRVPAAHTFVGMLVMEVTMVDRVEPSEVDALRTCAFVFVFIFVASVAVAVLMVELVFALIAVWLAVIAEPRELEAVVTSD
jgi:hypothetical protein